MKSIGGNMETNNIYSKLLNVQKKVGVLTKDKKNPFFKSNYLDINTIIEVLKPILNEEGLIILQPLGLTENGRMTLTTSIIKTDVGETIDFTTILPENPDPQKMGSIITYFRRYALQSLLFLQAEDNDGNDTKYVKTPQNAPQPSKWSKPMSVKGVDVSKEKAITSGYGEMITKDDALETFGEPF